jgi:hypothetical protein
MPTSKYRSLIQILFDQIDQFRNARRTIWAPYSHNARLFAEHAQNLEMGCLLFGAMQETSSISVPVQDMEAIDSLQ